MIQIVSNKFFSQWANGSTFGSNLTDFATHLKGSVGEKLKVETIVKVGISSVATENDPFYLQNGFTIKRNTGSWIADGFQLGQSLTRISGYKNGTVTNECTGTILTITDTEITLNITAGTFTTGTAFDDIYIAPNQFTGINFKFGLVGNNNAVDYNSPYSGDVQAYYLSGISSSFQPMLEGGGTSSSKSWNSGTAQVKYDSSSDPTGVAVAWLHEYVVTHEFIINPLFIEDYITNLEQGTQPEIFKAQGSLKYVTEYDFRLTLTNPNTKLIAESNQSLGAVAWLNENYNGFVNNYLVGGIDYLDFTNGNQLTGIQKNRKTKVIGSIISVNNSFTNTSKMGVYHSLCTTEAVYQSLQNSFQDTFLFDSVIDTMVSGTISGTGSGIIKAYKFDYVGTNGINFEFDIDYTTPQKDRILADSKFILGFQVGNANNTDTSDKIILQLDYNDYVINNDVEGLLTYENERFFLHPNDLTNGNTDYKGWKQDGSILAFDINLNKLLNANISALRCKIAAYNPTTKKIFDLQSYNYPLSGIVQVNANPSYQALTLDTKRNFKLKQGDNFNNVKLNFNTPVSNNQKVNVEWAFKFDWQSWVKLPNADTIFYDNSKDSKGMGLDSSRYSMLNGYEIRAVIETDVNQLTSDFTTYRNLSPTLNLQDYNKDGNLTPKWSIVLETFDESGTNNLSGAILKTANTLFRTTWTPSSGSTSDFNDYWAVHRIDNFKTTGYGSIEEISSEKLSLNNILIPLSGETKLKVTINPTNVITECLIDFTKLQGNYTLSTRLGVLPQYARYGASKDFKFLNVGKTEAIYFNGGGFGAGSLSNSLRLANLDSNQNVINEVSIALNQSYNYNIIRLAVDFNEVSNGKPVFYMAQYSGGDTQVHRFVYNGTTFTQSIIYNVVGSVSNMNVIRIDNQLSPNGRAYLWVGSNTSPTKYTHIYWNGTNWLSSEIDVYNAGNGNTLKFPKDVLFHDDNVYLMNNDDNTPSIPNQEKGKISVYKQTSGSLTTPADRTNFANYTWQYDMYRNPSGSVNVDGLGNVSDMAYGNGFELLDIDSNGNPIILVQHWASVSGARHFSRIFANTATPTSSADFTIQTPMRALNGQFANFTALSGKANNTSFTTKILDTFITNVAVIDANNWIFGGIGQGLWAHFTINDWTGVNMNDWYVCAPLDDSFTFTFGNILKK